MKKADISYPFRLKRRPHLHINAVDQSNLSDKHVRFVNAVLQLLTAAPGGDMD
jgi:hypothetical protein